MKVIVIPQLIAVLVSAIGAWTDVKTGKIHNRLTLTTIALAFVFHGWISGTYGLKFAGLGLLCTLPLMVFHILGMFGAGDVKLCMALGAWLGAAALPHLLLMIMMAGGFLAIIYLARQKDPLARFKRLFDYFLSIVLSGRITTYQDLGGGLEGTFAFAPAIFLGTLVILLDCLYF